MGAIATTQHESGKAITSSAVAGQYLTFGLGGEIYALGILNIKEIIDYDRLTEVPMMPAFVCGVINLRGRVVPIIDLHARFGKGKTGILKRTAIVIVETVNQEDESAQDIGIIVDAVNEVVEINREDIEPPPNFGIGIRPDFISGMAKRNGGFVILLSVDKVLSVAEMAALSKAEVEQPQRIGFVE